MALCCWRFLLCCCMIGFATAISEWHSDDGQTNLSLVRIGWTSKFALEQGRIWICRNGTCGSVCDDQFSRPSADVVCRMLGFDGATNVPRCCSYGQPPRGTPFFMSRVNCRGDEKTIFDCEHSTKVHGCSSRDIQGVQCKERRRSAQLHLDVRLYCPSDANGTCNTCPLKHRKPPKMFSLYDLEDSGSGMEGEVTLPPPTQVEGFVQVRNGENAPWVFASSVGWGDNSEIDVFCRQLGYPSSSGRPSAKELLGCDPQDGLCGGSSFQNEIYRITMRDIDCDGSEFQIGFCEHHGYFYSSNPSKEVATAACNISLITQAAKPISNARLIGKPNKPHQGRLEILHNGEWGTVCGPLTTTTAGVVCRSMGYSGVNLVYYRDKHSLWGYDRVWLEDVTCEGDESNIEECAEEADWNKPKSYDCSRHLLDVIIECRVPQLYETCEKIVQFVTELDPDYNYLYGYYLGRPSPYDIDYLEIKMNGQWGRVCFTNGPQDKVQGDRICTELSDNLFYNAISKKSPFQGIRYSGRFVCSGDEISINECQMDFVAVGECPSGETTMYCSKRLPDLVPSTREIMQSTHFSPYLTRSNLDGLYCEVEEGCVATDVAPNETISAERQLFKFSALTWNFGYADFTPAAHYAEWEYHTCHEHYHSMEVFAVYDFLTLDGNIAVEGLKASFCLEDVTCLPGRYRTYSCASPVFGGRGLQGISVGCGDLYSTAVACQWIDVTEVVKKLQEKDYGSRKQDFILRMIVNPDRLVEEINYDNNEIACLLTLDAEQYYSIVTVHQCARKGSSELDLECPSKPYGACVRGYEHLYGP